MENVGLIVDVISSVGFPIVCVIVMGWFIYQIFLKTTSQSQENMEKVQQRCQEREDKLYKQLEKQNEINGRFAEIIAQYEVKLDNIQSDINDIKTDITVIMSK